MPAWDFSCETCQTVQERHFVRYEESRHATCNVCGTQLDRLPSAPAVQFRGTGFYETDYKRRTGSR